MVTYPGIVSRFWMSSSQTGVLRFAALRPGYFMFCSACTWRVIQFVEAPTRGRLISRVTCGKACARVVHDRCVFAVKFMAKGLISRVSVELTLSARDIVNLDAEWRAMPTPFMIKSVS